MTDEMEYMSISQYCLNLIKNNIKLFFEKSYKSFLDEEYKSSEASFYDVMFYFSLIKKYLDEIQLPKIILNTIYNLKIFRNKIAHQVPITLREFYRFVDDTQTILELLNVIDQNEFIKIQNTRKEIIKRMCVLDDNDIIIGSSYNAGNNNNDNMDNISNNQNNLNINKFHFQNESDIEMGEYDDDNFYEIKDNSRYNYQNLINEGKKYNDFSIKQNYINNNINYINKDEIERKKKINENFNVIMSKTDKANFMEVKKIDFSKI